MLNSVDLTPIHAISCEDEVIEKPFLNFSVNREDPLNPYRESMGTPMKRSLVQNLLAILALLYGIVIFVWMTMDNSVAKFHAYITVFILFGVTSNLIYHVIKEQNRGIKLYIALGISCLSLGNVYFIFLDIVSVLPDSLSVGLFASVCCYLFFIAALTSFKPLTGKTKIFAVIINILSAIAAFLCAYAVVTNDIAMINTAVILLDLICILLAASLLSLRDARFFMVMMILLSASDILTIFVIMDTLLDAITPVLLIVFAQAVTSLKEGGQPA